MNRMVGLKFESSGKKKMTTTRMRTKMRMMMGTKTKKDRRDGLFEVVRVDEQLGVWNDLSPRTRSGHLMCQKNH